MVTPPPHFSIRHALTARLNRMGRMLGSKRIVPSGTANHSTGALMRAGGNPNTTTSIILQMITLGGSSAAMMPICALRIAMPGISAYSARGFPTTQTAPPLADGCSGDPFARPELVGSASYTRAGRRLPARRAGLCGGGPRAHSHATPPLWVQAPRAGTRNTMKRTSKSSSSPTPGLTRLPICVAQSSTAGHAAVVHDVGVAGNPTLPATR